MILLHLLPLFAAASFAAAPTFQGRVDAFSELPREELSFLGWSDACSAAISHLRFPAVGEGLQGEPVAWSIGTLTLEPGQTVPKPAWRFDSRQDSAWSRERGRQETEDLSKKFLRKGFTEKVRDAEVPGRADLTALLLSTASLRVEGSPAWPGEKFVPFRIQYHPLLQCALIIFRERGVGEAAGYKPLLVRLLDPGIRRERAHAHATNGILLYTKGSDLEAAGVELATAVELDPRRADARYHLALISASQGRDAEALNQLRSAVLLDPGLTEKAREALEFEPLRGDARFLDIVDKPL